jgi:hypothetical protein
LPDDTRTVREHPLSPRRNYGFDRRRKEEVRRTRQEAKKERKADRAGLGASGPEMGAPEAAGAPPDRWEWFSPSRGRVVTTEAKRRPPPDPPDDWTLLTDGAAATDADPPPG